jgi:hypothetical protein
MRAWRTILPIMAVLTVGACASGDGMGVGSTHDPLTRFPATATWSWDDQANRMPDDPRLEPLDLDAIIRQVAREEFARRGYTETTSGTGGDYRLSYELGMATWMSQTSATAIGSVSLTLVEAGSGRRVWVGFWRAVADVSLDREQRVERFRAEIRELLETFPPAQPH